MAFLFILMLLLIAALFLFAALTVYNLFCGAFIMAFLYVLCAFLAFIFIGLIGICYFGMDIKLKKKHRMENGNYIQMDFKMFKSVYHILEQHRKETGDSSQVINIYKDEYPVLIQNGKRTTIIFEKLFDEARYWNFFQEECKREKAESIKENENGNAYQNLIDQLQRIQKDHDKKAKEILKNVDRSV